MTTTVRALPRLLAAIALLGVSATGALACTVRESYVARLSPQDHYNSRGVRLTSAAAIIRQDRANFHLFGRRDAEDQNDAFFASKANREVLERLLERGRSGPGVLAQIVNGTPLIRVEVCSDNSGSAVTVFVLQGQ